MERTMPSSTQPEADSTVVIPAVALGFATCGAAALATGSAIGFLDPVSESLFVVLVILGWVLLVCAVLVGGAAAVRLVRDVVARRPLPLGPTILVTATTVVIVLTTVAYPLFGMSGGAG
ncbi:hypothetical protein ELQ90_12935 [Labedella phragmitis]|uniref:Uncharacterized protein n=1 Tax=Labedella phragmitis TaxID=2498849 RepID=A0A3S3ZN11_9MICO|nr:hypothetical protein [Labedella phragmitis]RWZ49654.1 hypothetical protein ELQ90_12935 [Labedella phragmitis]